jgi:hypothetical protein
MIEKFDVGNSSTSEIESNPNPNYYNIEKLKKQI